MKRDMRIVMLGSMLVFLAGCPSEPDSAVTATSRPQPAKPTPAPSANPNVTGGVSGSGNPTPTPSGTLAPAATPTPEPYLVSSYRVPAPEALASDTAGNFWIGSTTQALNSNATINALYKLSPTGTLLASASLGIAPRALVVDASNSVYATDGAQLLKLDANGATVLGPVSFNAQAGGAAIAIDNANSRLWVVGGAKVYTFSTALAAQNSYAFAATASANPASLALDGSGNAWVVGGSDAALINAGAPNDRFASLKSFNLWATNLQAVLVTPTNVWIGQPGIYLAKLDTSGAELGDYLPGAGAMALALDASGNLLAATTNGVTKLSNAGTSLASYTVNEGTSALLFAGSNTWFTSTGNGTLVKATF